MRAAAACAGVCALSVSLLAQGPADPSAALSKDQRHALDDALHHWALAAIDPQATACGQGGAAQTPGPVVTGDLNNDGRPDGAAVIKSDEGVRLLAFISRVDDASIVTVDTVTEPAGAVAVLPRGAPFKDRLALYTDFFSADTLTVARCGQPTVAYVWNGNGFRKTELASPDLP